MLFPSIQKSLIRIGAAVLILSVVGCDVLKQAFGSVTYSVKSVSDGDTITVTDAFGKDIKVRFACVDAPEVPHSVKERNSKKAVDKNQFKWGEKAQQRVKQLVEQGGNHVKLTVTDRDRYGRQVSEVRLPDGTFVQQVLVKEGLVQVYQPYLKNCPSAKLVQAAEADAKKRRVGVWRDTKYVSAWEWRSNNK